MKKMPIIFFIIQPDVANAINTFHPEFKKWTFPSLNLDKSIAANWDVNQTIKTKWQIVLLLMSRHIRSYTVCTST